MPDHTPGGATAPNGPTGCSARRHLAIAAAEAAAAGLLIAFFHWQCRVSAFEEYLLSYQLTPWMPAMEASFTLLFTAIGLPAIALAADALRRLWSAAGRRAPAAPPARAVLLLALLAAGATVVLHRGVLLEADFTDDERLYAYEAQALLGGRFTGAKPEPYAAFPHPFTVVTPDGQRMASIYPVGVPIALAVEAVLHLPHVFQAAFVFVAVLGAGALARRLFSSERAAVAAAALCATSPTLLLLGATRHNSVGAAAGFTVTVLACAWLAEGLSPRRAAAAGAAAGFTFLMRPDDGMLAVLLVAVCATMAAWPQRRQPLAVAAAALLSAGAFAAVAGVQFFAFRETTGSYFQSPYQYWVAQRWPGAKLFGFGSTVWGVQTVPSAFAKLVTALARLNLWVQGWPLSLALGAAALAFPQVRRQTRLLLAATGMVFTLYFLYATHAVNDFGSNYHLVAVPLIAALGAGGLQHLSRRMSATVLSSAVAAASLVGFATFWPLQLARLNLVAQAIAAPLEAAAGTPGDTLLVLWRDMQAPGSRTSWVFLPPLPSPTPGSERVLWFRDDPRLYAEAKARYGDRAVYRLVFDAPRRARLVPASLDSPRQ